MSVESMLHVWSLHFYDVIVSNGKIACDVQSTKFAICLPTKRGPNSHQGKYTTTLLGTIVCGLIKHG